MTDYSHYAATRPQWGLEAILAFAAFLFFCLGAGVAGFALLVSGC